ncbi:hypothetical protein BHM03_00035623 [Ensete ventricosum]|nr:hypothetical protein BHM03_00035623 [Ensete ventricosum]
MLMEDGSQGDPDHEAAATVEEEEGSSNTNCGPMVMLQVRRGYGSVISKWLLCYRRMVVEGSESRGSSDGGERRGQQQRRLWLRCDFVATSGDGSYLQAVVVEVVAASGCDRGKKGSRVHGYGSERSLLVAFVPQESAAGYDDSERSLPTVMCSERLLLVVIKSLLVAIKVDGSESRCWLRPRRMAAGDYCWQCCAARDHYWL